MIKGALEAARERGYMLFIGETEGDAASEQQLLDAMLDRQVDGIILASMFTRLRPLPRALEDVAAVLLNALPPGTTTVPASCRTSTRPAGRRRGRCSTRATGRSTSWVPAPRRAPCRPARSPAASGSRASATSWPTRASHRPAATSSRTGCPSTVRRDGRDLLATCPDPGALLCFNDRLAFGAYQALQEAGLRVPDDVSVVSFDDAPLAAWLEPGLSTFAIPHEALGRRSVELLLDLVHAGQAGGPVGAPPGTVHRLDMPFLLRGSIAAAR